MKLKILIVDDSEPFREILRGLLVQVGFDDVIEAANYDEAIVKYRTEKPDLVFIDMILPGKSGVEITKAILEIDPKATVIAISSMINKAVIKDALAAGAKDFLLKPTNEMALNIVIEMWGKE